MEFALPWGGGRNSGDISMNRGDLQRRALAEHRGLSELSFRPDRAKSEDGNALLKVTCSHSETHESGNFDFLPCGISPHCIFCISRSCFDGYHRFCSGHY